MAEEPNPDEKQYVTAYSGGPTYFTGTAEKPLVKTSIWAKLTAAAIIIGFALVIIWMAMDMNSALP